MGRKAKRARVLARKARLLGGQEAPPQPSSVSNSEMQEKVKKEVPPVVEEPKEDIVKEMVKEVEEMVIQVEENPNPKPKPKPKRATRTRRSTSKKK